jgi:hypothetical protein
MQVSQGCRTVNTAGCHLSSARQLLARIDRQSKFTFIQYFTSPGEVLEVNQTIFGVKQGKKKAKKPRNYQ